MGGKSLGEGFGSALGMCAPYVGVKNGAFWLLTAASVFVLDINLDKTKPISPEVTPFLYFQ